MFHARTKQMKRYIENTFAAWTILYSLSLLLFSGEDLSSLAISLANRLYYHYMWLLLLLSIINILLLSEICKHGRWMMDFPEFLSNAVEPWHFLTRNLCTLHCSKLVVNGRQLLHLKFMCVNICHNHEIW